MPIRATTRLFAVLLGLFAALPALSIDISAPGLSMLPDALHTTTMIAALTLPLFLAGFAAGQLGGGILSDRRGRRPVLLAALACYTAATVACALAATGPEMVATRAIQGVGAGACSVQAFAMVQDLFEGTAARSMRSYVTVVFGLVPMLAPALGTALIELAGWRSVHAAMAGAAAVLLVVTYVGVAESRGMKPKAVGSAGAAAPQPLWADLTFLGYAATNALSYGCLFAYIAGSPIVMMGQLGYTARDFALMFALTAASLTTGAWASGRMARDGVSIGDLLWPGLTIGTVATVALAALTWEGVRNGTVLLPLLMLTSFARGLVAPNLQQLAIERRRHQAGVASAAIGTTQLLAGALASAAVAALLGPLGPFGMTLPMACVSLGALIVWAAVAGRGAGSSR